MKIEAIFTLLLLSSLASGYTQSDNDLIVEIPNGTIKGIFEDSYIAFKGIPYAAPPIESNRFEDPKPYTEKWSGIKDATKFGNVCMQWNGLLYGNGDMLEGEEDCLYLNVFTPQLRRRSQLYPVIIHIHGGGYMFGNSNDFGPKLLLRHSNFVVVTLNYRLGPLGFLSTKDDQISGNMGLKDQQLALRWIKENIHIFNGNPENITLTGWSAGGASVHFQMLSDRNRGLFNTAISHSGTAFCAWVLERNPLEKAKKLANHVGCPTYNTTVLKDCLKEIPAGDIVRAVSFFQPFMYNPFTVFSPVIEYSSNENAFIKDDIENIIKEGKSLQVPWIVSYTHDDGGYNALTLMQKDENGSEYINNFDNKWPELASVMLFYNETQPKSEHSRIANVIKERYLGRNTFSIETYRKAQTMFTDYLYLDGIQKTLKLHMQYSSAPIYIYHYNRSLPIGLGSIETHRTDIDFGSVHGDDVFLIYNHPGVPIEKFTENDIKMSKLFANLYKIFSTNGTAIFDDKQLPKNVGPFKEFNMLLINDVDNYKFENVVKIIQNDNFGFV